MNRRALVLVTLIVAVLAFAAGAWYFSHRAPVTPSGPTLPLGSTEAPANAASGMAGGAAAVAAAPSVDADAASGGQASSSPPASAAPALMRFHSPVIGPQSAPVTIVEFFDPACEACRAFYPFVKQILEQHPGQVRLVLRYLPLHEGSDEAVRILEAARLQGLFEPVLHALLERQPDWARHGAPDLELAWQLAGQAGLDLDRARRDADRPQIGEVLRQDMADARAAGLRGTPSFFVNGQPLREFGPEGLDEQVKAALPPR
jgi:protein-disulfide isomerase